MIELARKSAIAVVVLHVESVSTSTPTGAVRGVHLAPLTALTLAAHALLHKTRASDNTAYNNKSEIYFLGKFIVWTLFISSIIIKRS